MLQVNSHRSETGGPGHLLIFVVLTVILIAIVAWGVTHRPTRSRQAPPPPTISVAEPDATPQPDGPVVTPTPTLGPNDVMVYTVDGQELCSGYPVGDLGYHLRCAMPAGVRLFRVVDADGEPTLAVRYTEQVLVRVGPR